MRRSGFELSSEHLFGESVERLRVLLEEVEGENSLRLGQVILLQTAVKASSRRAEIRDSGRNADTSAAQT